MEGAGWPWTPAGAKRKNATKRRVARLRAVDGQRVVIDNPTNRRHSAAKSVLRRGIDDRQRFAGVSFFLRQHGIIYILTTRVIIGKREDECARRTGG